MKSKVPATFKGLKYKKDETRPGHGVFVAHGKAKEGDYTGIPEGVVVIGANASDEESEGEDSATEVSSIIKPAAYEISSSSPSNPPSPSVPSSHPSGISRADGFQPPIAAAAGTRQDASAATQTQQQRASESASAASTPAPMVNYTPLSSAGGGNYPNVNPALNMAGASRSDVRVLNVLDVPPAPSTLEQFQVADSGLLEGLPGTMFDWRKFMSSPFSLFSLMMMFSTIAQWETFFSRFNPQQGFSVPTDPNALAAYAQMQMQPQHQQQLQGGQMNGMQQQQQQQQQQQYQQHRNSV